MPVGYLGKAGIVLFIATLFVPVLSCDLLLGSGNASDVEDEDDGSGGDSGGEDDPWSGLGYMVFSEMGKDDSTGVWIAKSDASLPESCRDESLTGASGDLVFFELETEMNNDGEGEIEEAEYVYPESDGDQEILSNVTVVRGKVGKDDVEYVGSTLSLDDLRLDKDSIDKEYKEIGHGSVDVSKEDGEYIFMWNYEYANDGGLGSYTGSYTGQVDDRFTGPRQ